MSSVQKGFKALPSADLRTSFEKANEYGFDFLEVPMHPLAECRRIAQRSEDVVAAAAENDVGVVAHLPHKPRDEICIASATESRRNDAIEAVKQSIEAASAIGASTGVLHLEAPDHHLADRDEQLLFDTLASLSEFARATDLELCVENLSRRYPTLDDFPRLLEQTPVSLTLDTGHARVNGYSSAEIATAVSEHSDRISHVHLNETRGEKDEHLPFGAGTIDFELIFDAFRDTDWSGSMTTEVKTHDFDYIRIGKEKLDDLI